MSQLEQARRIDGRVENENSVADSPNASEQMRTQRISEIAARYRDEHPKEMATGQGVRIRSTDILIEPGDDNYDVIKKAYDKGYVIRDDGGRNSLSIYRNGALVGTVFASEKDAEHKSEIARSLARELNKMLAAEENGEVVEIMGTNFAVPPSNAYYEHFRKAKELGIECELIDSKRGIFVFNKEGQEIARAELGSVLAKQFDATICSLDNTLKTLLAEEANIAEQENLDDRSPQNTERLFKRGFQQAADYADKLGYELRYEKSGMRARSIGSGMRPDELETIYARPKGGGEWIKIGAILPEKEHLRELFSSVEIRRQIAVLLAKAIASEQL